MATSHWSSGNLKPDSGGVVAAITAHLAPLGYFTAATGLAKLSKIDLLPLHLDDGKCSCTAPALAENDQLVLPLHGHRGALDHSPLPSRI
jgi:hypothetical protein